MELVWEHVTCVCLSVCAWTFIRVQVLRREWQRYVPTDTNGAYDMSRFRLNVHSLSLWKDCLVIFQVWYFLQGSWNHEPANQRYYCRWCVILLLKRNLNCLTLTLFFHFPESFKTLQKFETPAIQWQMHQVDIRYWQLIAIVASSFWMSNFPNPPAAWWRLGCLWSTVNLEVLGVPIGVDLGGEHQTAWRCYLATRCADHTLGFFTWLVCQKLKGRHPGPSKLNQPTYRGKLHHLVNHFST